MSLLSRIKEGIIKGDWQIVCNVYNMATGENLQPPVIKKVFNYKTANKKELLEWISGYREVESLTKTKISQLRDIAELLSFNDSLTEGESDDTSDDIADDFGLSRASTLPPVIQPSKSTATIKAVTSNAPSFFISPDRATVADKNRASKPLVLKAELGVFGTEGTVGHTSSEREPYQLYTARCLICQSPSQVPIERVNTIEGAGSATTTCDSCLSKPRH